MNGPISAILGPMSGIWEKNSTLKRQQIKYHGFGYLDQLRLDESYKLTQVSFRPLFKSFYSGR